MKTLLVGTDFTTASHNAFLYSLELAHALEAKIILFHAFMPVTVGSMETINVSTIQEELAATGKDRLQQHLRAAGAAIKVPVELRCVEGPAPDVLLEEAIHSKATFIITGMKEHGKSFRKLFGSTVTALVQISSIPMLVIPETAGYKHPANIALASDTGFETDVPMLDTLALVGQCFHSKIFIIRILQDRFEEVLELLHRHSPFTRLSRTLETEYTYYSSRPVTEALHDFIDRQHIDLVAMVPHRHAFLERLFHKSQTKSMVFSSNIPLLILPEPINQWNPAERQQTVLPDTPID